jgi:hypothetical protein
VRNRCLKSAGLISAVPFARLDCVCYSLTTDPRITDVNSPLFVHIKFDFTSIVSDNRKNRSMLSQKSHVTALLEVDLSKDKNL